MSENKIHYKAIIKMQTAFYFEQSINVYKIVVIHFNSIQFIDWLKSYSKSENIFIKMIDKLCSAYIWWDTLIQVVKNSYIGNVFLVHCSNFQVFTLRNNNQSICLNATTENFYSINILIRWSTPWLLNVFHLRTRTDHAIHKYFL